MKLRLAGATVRLRLDAGDVEDLRSNGRVEGVLAVEASPHGAWRYALVASAATEILTVALDGSGLEILVPEQEAMAWAASDSVGIYGEANGLAVKLEKDLGCDHEIG